MLKHVELDPTLPLERQFTVSGDRTTILLNVFDVDVEDAEAFKRAWQKDAEFFKRQPGYISAQLHHGIGGSRMWFNYAVFETAAKFGGTTTHPEFKPLRAGYPDSATAHPHLFHRVNIPGICVGEE